jgi:hypothetical protein
LVFGAIVYSGVVSSLMVLFGHHLSGVIERTQQSEAELRSAVDWFRGAAGQAEDASTIAEKKQKLRLKLQALLLWWREYCWQLVLTTRDPGRAGAGTMMGRGGGYRLQAATSFLVSKFNSMSTLLGSRTKICQRVLPGT